MFEECCPPLMGKGTPNCGEKTVSASIVIDSSRSQTFVHTIRCSGGQLTGDVYMPINHRAKDIEDVGLNTLQRFRCRRHCVEDKGKWSAQVLKRMFRVLGMLSKDDGIDLAVFAHGPSPMTEDLGCRIKVIIDLLYLGSYSGGLECNFCEPPRSRYGRG